MRPGEPTLECVVDDLKDSFVRSLSDADLAGLTIELGRIAFGGETGAVETTKQEVVTGDKGGRR
jgi:hypothetical protein